MNLTKTTIHASTLLSIYNRLICRRYRYPPQGRRLITLTAAAMAAATAPAASCQSSFNPLSLAQNFELPIHYGIQIDAPHRLAAKVFWDKRRRVTLCSDLIPSR